MAISDRISAMYDHVGDIYDTLELGGDTTQNKNIVNINNEIKREYKDFLANGTDTLWNNWNKVNGTGESLTLNNTIKAKMKIDLKGNTSQETTTGKNLCPPTWNGTVGNITFTNIYDENGNLAYIDVNGTASSVSYINVGIKTYSAGTYVISGSPSGGSNSTYQQRIVSGESALATDNGSGATFTLNSDAECFLRVRIASGYTANHLKFYPMVRLSSITDATYEPYTNGASPNPDYPQDINVVSGDNSIKVENKNLFDKNNIDWSNSNVVFFTSIFLGTGTYTMSSPNMPVDTSSSSFKNLFFLANKVSSGASSSVNGVDKDTPRTVTSTDGYVTIAVRTKVEDNIYNVNPQDYDWMIEKGSTATEYEEHQTYPINLGSMELCKIGDYQDYIYKEGKKWYKYKAIQKVVLDNGVGVSISIGKSNTTFFQNADVVSLPLPVQTMAQGFCNIFTPNLSTLYESDILEGFTFSVRGYLRFNILNTRAGISASDSDSTKLTKIAQWLQNNNLMLYYILPTPTTEEITDTTLINQLNNLYYARSYDGQTNISSSHEEGNAPMILDASALKGEE